MSEIAVSNHGVIAAPHAAAAETGRRILIEGGNAWEAMVGMAATLAVVAPETATLGGDAVWLVREPTGVVRLIDACGRASSGATLSVYHRLGHHEIPARGPLSVLTAPGVVDGWRLALDISAASGGRLPLDILLSDAVRHARDGFRVPPAPDWTRLPDWRELAAAPGFADALLVEGKPRGEGELFAQPKLADALDHLARAGLTDFYRGDVAREIANDLDRIGAPVTRGDFRKVEARLVQPLTLPIRGGAIHGARPQGLETLVALGMLERLGLKNDRDAAFVHGIAEAVKHARAACGRFDPDDDPEALLAAQALEREAFAVDPRRAAAVAPWFRGAETSVWMGVVDVEGRAISCAQSPGALFGSGCALPATGVLIGNRGAGFALDPDAPHALAPGKRPPLGPSPALAVLTDGRVSAFGGPAETQTALFVRHAGFGRALDDALAQPMFRLGSGAARDAAPLALGPGFDDEIADRLERLGHRVVALTDDIGAAFGSAGLIVRDAGGRITGGYRPGASAPGGATLGL